MSVVLKRSYLPLLVIRRMKKNSNFLKDNQQLLAHVSCQSKCTDSADQTNTGTKRSGNTALALLSQVERRHQPKNSELTRPPCPDVNNYRSFQPTLWNYYQPPAAPPEPRKSQSRASTWGEGPITARVLKRAIWCDSYTFLKSVRNTILLKLDLR